MAESIAQARKKGIGFLFLGLAAMAAGIYMIYSPTFLGADEFNALAQSDPYRPFIGAGLAALGAALMVASIHFFGPDEKKFALEGKFKGSIFARLRELDPRFFFVATWKELDREAAEERKEEAESRRKSAKVDDSKRPYDIRPIVIFTSGAVFLSLMEYFGHATGMHRLLDAISTPEDPTALGSQISDLLLYSQFSRLVDFMWWSAWRVLGFFLLPAMVIKFILRERVVDHGLQTKGFVDHLWIYALFFLIVLVAVGVVSFDEHFSTYYPFYENASRSWFDFWAWELLYAAQFFSLEFFFRGFWLKAAKPSLGSHAIFAMVVPYCMIHFGKPFLETIAAIFAGVVLGTLALRTRSIWSGFLIHVSVAISMDLAAIMQTNGLPTQFWPVLGQ